MHAALENLSGPGKALKAEAPDEIPARHQARRRAQRRRSVERVEVAPQQSQLEARRHAVCRSDAPEAEMKLQLRSEHRAGIGASRQAEPCVPGANRQ